MSDHRVNDRIRAREVRLIDPEGKQLGVKALPDALTFARQLDLDLVEVAPDANPPVCRIMDYNRFKYETAQKAKESRKKATNTSIKEMKYRPKIGTGDFLTKTRQVGRFLEEGHKVKVTIMFRGREVSHPELGMKILEGLAEEVAAVAKVEAAPKLDGRNMVMVLAPDRRAKPPARKPTPGTGEDSAAHASAARDGAVGAAAEAVTDGAAPGNVLAPLPPGTSGATSTSGAAVAVAVDGERAPTPSAASAPGAAGEGDTDAGLAAVVSANGSPVPGGVVGASS